MGRGRVYKKASFPLLLSNLREWLSDLMILPPIPSVPRSTKTYPSKLQAGDPAKFTFVKFILPVRRAHAIHPSSRRTCEIHTSSVENP